ncbi:hypothetical protein ACVIEM_002893 [Rhizobium leguminosarum]
MTQDGVSPAAAGETVTTVTDRRALFAVPGLVLAGGALLCATATLFVLLGLTPIAPTSHVVITSVIVNSFFVLTLLALIAREVARLLKARTPRPCRSPPAYPHRRALFDRRDHAGDPRRHLCQYHAECRP